MAGCARSHYSPPSPPVPEEAGLTLFEESIGDEIYERSRQIGFEPDPHYKTLVEKQGKKIIPYLERKNIPYRFYVLNSDVELAYSAPDGGIYVSRGMVQLLNGDESLLTALAAHELAHVSAKHSIRTFQRTAYTDSSRAMKKTAVDYGVTLLTLGTISLTDDAINLMLEQKHSIQEEIDADLLGARYLKMAGEDPRAFERLFEALEKIKGSQPLFFATHPRHKKRKAYVHRYLEEVLLAPAR